MLFKFYVLKDESQLKRIFTYSCINFSYVTRDYNHYWNNWNLSPNDEYCLCCGTVKWIPYNPLTDN